MPGGIDRRIEDALTGKVGISIDISLECETTVGCCSIAEMHSCRGWHLWSASYVVCPGHGQVRTRVRNSAGFVVSLLAFSLAASSSVRCTKQRKQGWPTVAWQEPRVAATELLIGE